MRILAERVGLEGYVRCDLRGRAAEWRVDHGVEWWRRGCYEHLRKVGNTACRARLVSFPNLTGLAEERRRGGQSRFRVRMWLLGNLVGRDF